MALGEDVPIWDIPQEQLHQAGQLLNRYLEAQGCIIRSLPQGLVQSHERVAILPSDCLYPPSVVEESDLLVAGAGLWEVGFHNQVLGLVIIVIVKVVPEKQVQEVRLALLVVIESCIPIGLEENVSNRSQLTSHFIAPR